MGQGHNADSIHHAESSSINALVVGVLSKRRHLFVLQLLSIIQLERETVAAIMTSVHMIQSSLN